MRWVSMAVVMLVLSASPAWGQETDTTGVAPADSVQQERQQPRAQPERPPIGFLPVADGVAVTDTLPVRLPVLDPVGLLADVPGSFLYAFGTPGWPEGWSPYGLPPQDVRLVFERLPFDDLFTGRPRYDLVPLAWTRPPRLTAGRHHGAVGVVSPMRALRSAAPLTEMHYVRGDDGLQSVDVVHAQRRRWTLFGRPGYAQLLGAYSGRGSDGEYPSSRLSAARHLVARLRYEQAGWSAELLNVHNRRTVGAHGGVEPYDPADYATIYLRTLATVRNPDAARRTVRNDLSFTLNAPLTGPDPLVVTGFWTAETSRYRDRLDTLGVQADRVGLRVEQALRVGRHRARLSVEGWYTALDGVDPVADRLGGPSGAGRLHAAVRDSLRFGRTALALEAGLHAFSGTVRPGAVVGATREVGAGRAFAEVTLSGPPPAPVLGGFGGYVLPAEAEAPPARRVLARAGLEGRAGPFDGVAFGFASHTANARDVYATPGTDTVQVASATVGRAGVAVDLGWRREAARGLYATAQSAAYVTPGADPATLAWRLEETLPAVTGGARLGARFVLFVDLDLDVYVEGRAWSALRSRVLHPPTGLLAVPLPDGRRLGPSGTLDAYIEGNIRGAKVFLGYENVLSGTTFMPGTMLVPDYPLPDQHFRFGVYWPIFG